MTGENWRSAGWRQIVRAFGLSAAAVCSDAIAQSPPADVRCARTMGRLLAIQGQVDVQRDGSAIRRQVERADAALCSGDWVHVGPRSRAALIVDPETYIRLDEASSMRLTLEPNVTLIELVCGKAARLRGAPTEPRCRGAGYFISRFPRRIRVDTRFNNATYDGTEFLVAVNDESAEVVVFEGRVTSTNKANGDATTVTGGSAVTHRGAATEVRKVIRPTDAIQWTLNYPRLDRGRDAGTECDTADAECRIGVAEALLQVGQVDAALVQLQGLDQADALALAALVGVVNNNKVAARTAADAALARDVKSARAHLAQSLVAQAEYQLPPALVAAQEARRLAPESALAAARVAELLLALGQVEVARTAAEQITAAHPSEPRGWIVLGFVRLAEQDAHRAQIAFERAIALDAADPHAHLGLGLARIKQDDLPAGRADLEAAVVLDPAQSLLRSYLGKAYYAENTDERDQLAGIQFDVAQTLDPSDPTPWFYGAIRDQAANQPGSALGRLHRSGELNDRRASPPMGVCIGNLDLIVWRWRRVAPHSRTMARVPLPMPPWPITT